MTSDEFIAARARLEEPGQGTVDGENYPVKIVRIADLNALIADHDRLAKDAAASTIVTADMARRNDAWRAQVDEHAQTIRDLQSALASKDARTTELEAALEPFAALSPSSFYAADGSEEEGYTIYLESHRPRFTGADLARARSLLAPAQDGKDIVRAPSSDASDGAATAADVRYSAPHLRPGPWSHDGHGLIWAPSLKGGGMTRVMDVRGWGYLTGGGHGALGMPEAEALKTQHAWGDIVAAAVNEHYARRAQDKGERSNG